MARFTLPRDLYHGKGALEELKHFEGKKAVVCVGGGSMKRFGFLDRAVGYLKEAGMEVELIEGIESDPSVETVMKGAQKMIEFQPDWIIAMGGGSPIDAAKAMWIKYEYPDVTFEDMCKVFGLPKLRQKAHFCAISSTSGTATEVTAFSIITDYQKGIKYPIADFEITPDVAIVDPDLAETMPKKLVAHTGMDAMTHAIEAYVSTANCDFTDPLAIHAIEMIMKDLIPSYNGDMTARDNMHNAQCLAGMAFSNALLGIVHSMAHKTGAAFADYGAHIIHGAANAMYLPKVIAFNAKDETAKKRYGVIAEALVVDSKAGVKQSVKNEAFCARGGTSRRVFYVPARSGTQAMRYTGEYQIAKSKEGAETLRVTIAGRFTAAPGDIAAVSGTKIGIVGNFRVIECVRRFGESGEACEVTMQRE